MIPYTPHFQVRAAKENNDPGALPKFLVRFFISFSSTSFAIIKMKSKGRYLLVLFYQLVLTVR
jgi:hypothetical protein